MKQCDLNKMSVGSTTGRAENLAAIAGFAEEVDRLALHFKITAAIACADEAELAAEALRTATERSTEAGEPLLRLEAVSDDDAQAGPTLEIPTAEMSLQPNGLLDNARNNEKQAEDDLCAVRAALAKIGAAFANPTDESPREEKAIVGCIAELHGLFGGFIKPTNITKIGSV